jgi:hypothetical protein
MSPTTTYAHNQEPVEHEDHKALLELVLVLLHVRGLPRLSRYHLQEADRSFVPLETESNYVKKVGNSTIQEQSKKFM